jgi:hypothetical protein
MEASQGVGRALFATTLPCGLAADDRVAVFVTTQGTCVLVAGPVVKMRTGRRR